MNASVTSLRRPPSTASASGERRASLRAPAARGRGGREGRGALAVPSAGVLLALVLAGCAPRFERWAYRPEGPPPPEGLQRLEERNPATDALERAWTIRYEDDGRAVREGLEQLWWPEGTLRAERRWNGGEPDGLWRSWHRSGQLEMEHLHGEEAAPMTFFHAEGTVRAMGAALRGVKEGEWSFFRVDGSLEKRGNFRGGTAVGMWTHYHPNLGLAERGRMDDGRRSGEWRRWPAEPPTWSDPFWPPEERAAPEAAGSTEAAEGTKP